MCTSCIFVVEARGSYKHIRTLACACTCLHTYVHICTYVNLKLIIWVKYQKFWNLGINVARKVSCLQLTPGIMSEPSSQGYNTGHSASTNKFETQAKIPGQPDNLHSYATVVGQK